jgi:mannose-6-phosphate isomerase-like protein (cupin superfamily)
LEVAPDGSNVFPLLRTAGASVARFELAAGKTSKAVAHRTAEEIWYVLSGRGELWRKEGGREEVVTLEPGVGLTIPCGAHFQFRALGEPLQILGVTMPPWPGDGEAMDVPGKWPSP